MSGRKNRIPELDGLRVVMIFIVSVFHFWQQSWLEPRLEIPALGISESLDWLARTGYIWVDGTVLLSVFLLFLPWAKAMRTGGPNPDTRDFYFRRARRVLPGYWFIVLGHLFFIALPYGLYKTDAQMVKDLATHLSFTFTRYSDTYLDTKLGGGAWTLAILVQGYVLFPFMAAAVRKRPVLTLGAMLLVCFGFRSWCVWGLSDYRMVVNRLVNFLDVYVIGILCAMGYTALREWTAEPAGEGKPKKASRYLRETAATVLFACCVLGLIRMLKLQAVTGSQLQKFQMLYRPVFAVCFGGMILSAPFMLRAFRLLLGNPVTRFLSGISMNYYLVHQTAAVHLKTRLQLPFPVADVTAIPYGHPVPWQRQYTALCILVSLVMAAAVTYLVEKPGARLFDRARKAVISSSAKRRGSSPPERRPAS